MHSGTHTRTTSEEVRCVASVSEKLGRWVDREGKKQREGESMKAQHACGTSEQQQQQHQKTQQVGQASKLLL